MTITIRYWRGTLQLEDIAETYAEAMTIAGRNQNAYDPTFWDEDGRQLHDDGNGLAYEEEVDGRRVYAVTQEWKMISTEESDALADAMTDDNEDDE